MAGDVVDFPVGRVRDWADLRRTIYELSAFAGSDDAFAECVCVRIRPLFDLLSEGVPGYSIEAASEACGPALYRQREILDRFIVERNAKIIAERIKREFEDYM